MSALFLVMGRSFTYVGEKEKKKKEGLNAVGLSGNLKL